MQLVRTTVGFLLLVLGVASAIPLPELGVPLILVGLRILGRYYRWARVANAWVDARWAEARAAFHRQPILGKVAIVALLLAAAVGLVWIAITHV